MNRLTRARVLAVKDCIRELERDARPLIITGNEKYFSVGADLEEVSALTGPAAYQFAQMGQALMSAIAGFPNPVIAAIQGYCMGGGLDLALACHRRVASEHAHFGHRGAALGLMTGWGGTQRLPRLLGKSAALKMFAAAEHVSARRALELGLVEALVADPVQYALDWLSLSSRNSENLHPPLP